MDINLVIAENCKRIRKIQKMSIERTAEVAGVSRSMLGQIERGEANPSAALLFKIASALKVPMEELLRYEPETDDRLFRGIDCVADRADNGKVLIHETTPYDSFAALEQKRIDVFISGKFDMLPEKPGCIGYLLLVSGNITVTIGDEVYQMEQWDNLRFHADRPCKIENNHTSTARAVLTLRYMK